MIRIPMGTMTGMGSRGGRGGGMLYQTPMGYLPAAQAAEYNRIASELAQQSLRESEQYAEEGRERALDLTEGTAGRIMRDPITMGAIEQAQLGYEGPMTQGVQDAMLSQQSDMAAAAQRAQDELLRRQVAASGGSMYDRSAQAQQAKNLQQRQLANQASARDIALNAAMQNYQGRQQTAQQVSGMRGRQYAQSQPYQQQAANWYATQYKDPKAPTVQQVKERMPQQSYQPKKWPSMNDFRR